MRNLTSPTMMFLAVLIFTGMPVLSSTAAAADDAVPSIEFLASELATTAAQHEALASFYRDKAANERSEAKKHQKMAAAYGNRTVGAAPYMRTHCEQLVEAAEKAATAYDAMAAIHDGEAKKAPK